MRVKDHRLFSPVAATVAVLPAFIFALGLSAQSPAQFRPDSTETPRVGQTVDNSVRSLVVGTPLPLLGKMQSKGGVSDSTPISHMQLLLKPSAVRASALTLLITAQHDPKSSNFHQWVTPEQFGISYGLSHRDIDAIEAWLLKEGFTINGVYPNKLQIDFSDTAGLIKRVFFYRGEAL